MNTEPAATYPEVVTDAPNPKSNPEPAEAGGIASEPPRQLRRSHDGKVIAGVARGLGNRFDLDANIFRVIFVVLTLFWGLGVAIYLAMWVFVPRSAHEEAARRYRPPVSQSHRLTVAVVAGVLVLAAMLALLAIGRPIRHGGPSLALLWLVFLIALAVVALRTSARRLTVRRFFAVTFLVVLSGVILFLGAVLGFLASTGVALSGGDGAHSWQPTALRDVQHRYTTEFGSTALDLQAITFPSSGFVIDASTAVGILRITVPANTVVSVTTHVGIGPVEFYEGTSMVGTFASDPATGSGGTARIRAPHLSIDARVGIGRIVIVRATKSSPSTI